MTPVEYWKGAGIKFLDPANEDEEVKGGVTDGVTRIKIEINGLLSLDQKEALVTLEDKGTPPSKEGLGQLCQATTLPSESCNGGLNLPAQSLRVRVNREIEDPERFKAELIYQVPETFVREGRKEIDKEQTERFVMVKVSSIDGAIGVSSRSLQLKRPPVLLVHGIWASGAGEDDSWRLFAQLLNAKQQFFIKKADYKRTNSDHFSTNVLVIPGYIKRVMDAMRSQHLAATKVDIVAHSMGALITLEYCKGNAEACRKQVHKMITIDTPYRGTELADVLIIYRDHKDLFPNQYFNAGLPVSCYAGVEAFVTGYVKVFNVFPHTNLPHPIDLGAVDDLASGRWTEYPFVLVPGGAWQGLPDPATLFPVHTIVGVSSGGLDGYDDDIKALWEKVLSHCGFTRQRVFGVQADENDRIVPRTSQGGRLVEPATEQIDGVDHSSVLRDLRVIDRVKALLDDVAGSPNFSTSP